MKFPEPWSAAKDIYGCHPWNWWVRSLGFNIGRSLLTVSFGNSSSALVGDIDSLVVGSILRGSLE